ncbi:MAG: exoprotein, partial [Pseudomonadota bacterium]
MGSAEADTQQRNSGDAVDEGGGVSWLALAGWAVLALLVVSGAYLWLSRERIAGDLIDDYLAQTGLEASYDIVSIGPQRQVIANVVIGNPASPDLTIDRVSVDVAYGFGAPGVGAVTLDRPRLYGEYRDGALTFGALDPLLFPEDDLASSGLPSLDVTVRGGGARLVSEFGELGAYLDGSGPLDDGFAGTLALVTPGAGVEGCGVARSTAYGDFSIESGVPSFNGPLRLRDVACEGARMASADMTARLTTDADFAKLDGAFDIAAGAMEYGEARAQGLKGRATLSLAQGALILDHDLTFAQLEGPYAALASLNADGAVRSARGFSQTSWNAKIEGGSVSLANAANGALNDAREASEGTMVASLLTKLESGLASATRDASLTGNVTARADGEALSLVVPEARLRSAAGKTVLAVSRLNWSVANASSAPRLAGNFLTGGRDLPQITGRIDQSGNTPISARLSVAPYRAGNDRIAVPALSVRGVGQGGFVFTGSVRASGAIPGGAVDALEVPVNGRYDPRAGLRVGTACETVRFRSLSAYDLALEGKTLRLCPDDGAAMVAYQDTLDIRVSTDALALEGELAGSPLALSSTSARLSYPEGFALTDVAAMLGEEDNAVRLTGATLTGGFDEPVGGEFDGATARLDAVPLDLSQMAGLWSYTDGVLRVDDTRLIVTERTADGLEPRFNPLSAQAAQLSFADSQITARADLRHMASGTPVADVAIRHDLTGARGSADIAVDGLTFGPTLSVADLSKLAKGVIAYTDGTVTGEGRVEWVGEEVTSGGVFRTDDLDLAAAFGPVTGLKGEIRFTDLINLTTAPSQVIEIGSINPGIEALSG